VKEKPSKITHNIANSLQIPRDLAYKDAIITMIGSAELYIENYKCILEYEERWIIVQTKTNKVKVEGKHLQIEYYTNDEMKIKGKIAHVFYET